MKKQYQKPLLVVEHYSLTQTVASCSGIKINVASRECVLADPDSTNMMINLAYRNGFLNPCDTNLSGTRYDGVCYHTNINAAFSS